MAMKSTPGGRTGRTLGDAILVTALTIVYYLHPDTMGVRQGSFSNLLRRLWQVM
jgi:hypothetical protein